MLSNAEQALLLAFASEYIDLAKERDREQNYPCWQFLAQIENLLNSLSEPYSIGAALGLIAEKEKQDRAAMAEAERELAAAREKAEERASKAKRPPRRRDGQRKKA